MIERKIGKKMFCFTFWSQTLSPGIILQLSAFDSPYPGVITYLPAELVPFPFCELLASRKDRMSWRVFTHGMGLKVYPNFFYELYVRYL